VTKDYMPIINGLRDDVVKRCMERARRSKGCPEGGATLRRLKERYI
jgi:hypothetical protein